MSPEPIFCYPALDDATYASYLRSVYEGSVQDHDQARELTPLQTAGFAERAVATRLGILRKVYAGEYFTDSFDFPRLAQRVSQSREFIWFWGRRQVVSEWLDGVPADPANCDLGTVSVIDSSEEFGAGMGEICRSGSMTNVLLKPYAVKRILDFLTAGIPALHDAFHTLLLVPRVRTSGSGIRGGKSVNTIHKKYIRSRFWGFAPWYVMQGGILECLEYREVNRRLADVQLGMAVYPRLHFAHEEDSEFAKALFVMNFPAAVAGLSVEVGRSGGPVPSLGLTCQAGESIRQYNHRAFHVLKSEARLEDGFSLDQIESTLGDTSCTVIHVDVSSPDNLSLQQALRARGYCLTCLRPPRSIHQSGTDAAETPVPCFGSWAKPNPRWPIAAPHYVVRDSTDFHEHCVVRHLRRLLELWRTPTTPGALGQDQRT